MGLGVFIPLDVFCLHLVGKPGIVGSSLGLLLMVLGWWIARLSLRDDAFASVVVRHPQEGQQRVIDTGVYSVVRHPLYVGGLILVVGMPLLVGVLRGLLACRGSDRRYFCSHSL